jgi:hypothetical protein
LPTDQLNKSSENILTSEVKIPSGWNDAKILGSRMTQRKLLMQRKEANLPH